MKRRLIVQATTVLYCKSGLAHHDLGPPSWERPRFGSAPGLGSPSVWERPRFGIALGFWAPPSWERPRVRSALDLGAPPSWDRPRFGRALELGAPEPRSLGALNYSLKHSERFIHIVRSTVRSFPWNSFIVLVFVSVHTPKNSARSD